MRCRENSYLKSFAKFPRKHRGHSVITFALIGGESGSIKLRMYANKGRGGSYQSELSQIIFLIDHLVYEQCIVINRIDQKTKAGCLNHSQSLLSQNFNC